MAKKIKTPAGEVAIAKSVDAHMPKGKPDKDGFIPAGKSTVYDTKTGSFVDRTHLRRFSK